MRRWIRLWLLRWHEESLLGSVGHHQAMRDLHDECYDKASEALRRVRIEIAALTPAHKMIAEMRQAQARGRA